MSQGNWMDAVFLTFLCILIIIGIGMLLSLRLDKHAFRAGYRARKDGRPLLDNPYQYAQLEYIHWVAGWKLADEELERENE